MKRNLARWIALAIFIATLALYVRTTAPTLGGGWDSEEFQHAAYTLGIAHSTGYPLYLLIGKIFTTLVPLGNVAYRMNLLSAVIGAFTASVVYLNALTLTKSQIASIAASALFATNAAVWRQAGVASVGPLNLLLLASLMYALLLWQDKRTPLTIAALIFGLSLAHHRTTLFLLPAILIFIFQVDAALIKRPCEIAKLILAIALPLLLYFYLPIFGNNAPWYSNTFENFIAYVSGSEAGNYTRATPLEIAQAFIQILLYLHESFGYLGLILILVGALSALPRWRTIIDSRIALFLGLGVLTYTGFATLVSGEPDRYLVLPFVFLAYWFALGISNLESHFRNRKPKIENRKSISSFILHPSSLRIILAIALTLIVALPFPTRFRLADWSAFDRVYKQWDEIFTLPIPANATLVGNWSQLNAMRYLQRVGHRRTDIQAIGTLYDTAPQTIAAQNAFADGRAIFLAPGIAQPSGDYRYAQLGPLFEVRDQPQMHAPASAKNISLNSSLTLADYNLSIALEPYAPLASIAPNRTARATLVWRAEASVKDFLVRIKLYDPENRVIAQKDEAPVRGLYAASLWMRGEYVSDVHNILIPAGAPPGTYQLKLQTLDAETKKSTSDEIALGSFAVERATNLTREQVFIAQPLDYAVNNQIDLWGCGGCNGTQRISKTLSINLLWHAKENIDRDYDALIKLFDASGNLVRTWQTPPIVYYPSSQWRKGELLKAYYDLPLPNDFSVGDYTLHVGIESGSLSPIGKIQIVP